MNNLFRRLIDVLLEKLKLMRKSEVELALGAAKLEAERLAEEHKWKIEAALEAERKQLEWEKQGLEMDRLEMHAYAGAMGIPLLEERPWH